MKIIMRCGHVALGKDMHEGTPVCPVCVGFSEEAFFVLVPQPTLSGRNAACVVCEEQVPSNVSLPFFQYLEGGETDEYYCGCREWEGEGLA